MDGEKRMKRRTTDQLLILGMALTTDRRAMERRVRGVFARKRSAKATLALSLALVLALVAGGFTTACRPEETQEASYSPIPTEAPQTQTADANPLGETESLAHAAEITRARVLRIRDAELENNGAFPAPRLGNCDYTERGNWSAQKKAGEETAKAAFLAIANRVFYANYTPSDLTATYYRDNTGVRADVWRLDSTDGALNGALDAETLQFISAQCRTIPHQQQHASIVAAGKAYDSDAQRSLLDSSSAITRISAALGVTVDATDYNSYQTSYHLTYGWGVCEDVQFLLDNGKFCTILLFGDERLTPYAVAVYPDADCLLERVYWRADLQWTKSAVKLKDPIDFRIGEPEKGDLSRERAIADYRSLTVITGCGEGTKEPAATFYRDYSGARESYWHLQGDEFTMDIAAKTGHVFNLVAPQGDLQSMDLPAVSFADTTQRSYEEQSRRILEALLGGGVVSSANFESISDGANCTVSCGTSDGALYSVFFADRALCTIDYYIPLNEGEIGLYRNWRADYLFVNIETGEVFLAQS